MTRLKWEDIFEAKPSMNTRNEETFDIYRKATGEMLYCDILVEDIGKIQKQMVDLIENIAMMEIEEVLLEEEKPTADQIQLKKTLEDFEKVKHLFAKYGKSDS